MDKNRLTNRIDPIFNKPTLDPAALIRDIFRNKIVDQEVGRSEQIEPLSPHNKAPSAPFSVQIETASGTIIRVSSAIDGAKEDKAKVEIFGELSKTELETIQTLAKDLASLKSRYQNEGSASLSTLAEGEFEGIQSFGLFVGGDAGGLSLDYKKSASGFSLDTSLDGYTFEINSDHTGANIGGYENDLAQFRQDIASALGDYRQDQAASNDAIIKKSFLLESLQLASTINHAAKDENDNQKQQASKTDAPDQEAKTPFRPCTDSQHSDGMAKTDDPLIRPEMDGPGAIGNTGVFVDFEIFISTPAERYNGYNSSEVSQANISIRRKSELGIQTTEITSVRHVDEINTDIRQHKGIAGDSVMHANFSVPDLTSPNSDAPESAGQTYQYQERH